jgi:hypothetical protein
VVFWYSTIYPSSLDLEVCRSDRAPGPIRAEEEINGIWICREPLI